MDDTFEEMLGGRLPGLYAGARFMAAGRDRETADLLTAAVVRAFDRFGGWSWDGVAGFERALAEVALERWRTGRSPSTPALERPARRSLVVARALSPNRFTLRSASDISAFYEAARVVPLDARVAIWLVTLERWSYGDAAGVLGLPRAELSSLLAWRERLIAALAGESRSPAAQGESG